MNYRWHSRSLDGISRICPIARSIRRLLHGEASPIAGGIKLGENTHCSREMFRAKCRIPRSHSPDLQCFSALTPCRGGMCVPRQTRRAGFIQHNRQAGMTSACSCLQTYYVLPYGCVALHITLYVPRKMTQKRTPEAAWFSPIPLDRPICHGLWAFLNIPVVGSLLLAVDRNTP